MKRVFMRRSIIGVLLLLVLSISVANTFLVRAEEQGIGKYLTIYVNGEGNYVNATKKSSGQVFTFNQEEEQHKVGAGNVTLEAVAAEGWEFVEWKGDYLATTENPVEFKNQKYAEITAVFREKIYIITASSGEGGSIIPDGEVPVTHGTDQTFLFSAETGFHVSSIVVDGAYVSSFSNGYPFYNVVADHTIAVSFSEDGKATIPADEDDVTVFISPEASLSLNAIEGGIAEGLSLSFPDGTAVTVWEITVTATFDGNVLIALHYEDTGNDAAEEDLRLIRGGSFYSLYSDVNNDLIVDGTDVSIVANAVKQSQWYDPFCDINNDDVVNEEDVHIVNENKGTTLQDITDHVDVINNIIYGLTDQFSVFRAR